MFIAKLSDHGGDSRFFGPFTSDLAARDWGMEVQELGLFPSAVLSVTSMEEPIDLGFDPGL